LELVGFGRSDDKSAVGREKSGPNPCDRVKSGVKRRLLTEAAGIPVGLEVEGANRHDMKMVAATLASVPQEIEDRRLEHLESEECEQGLCVDAGYDYDSVREIVEAFGYTAHIRSGARKPERVQPARRRGAGSWSELIAGSTGIDACW
jgi:hypothetical protein